MISTKFQCKDNYTRKFPDILDKKLVLLIFKLYGKGHLEDFNSEKYEKSWRCIIFIKIKKSPCVFLSFLQVATFKMVPM